MPLIPHPESRCESVRGQVHHKAEEQGGGREGRVLASCTPKVQPTWHKKMNVLALTGSVCLSLFSEGHSMEHVSMA